MWSLVTTVDVRGLPSSDQIACGGWMGMGHPQKGNLIIKIYLNLLIITSYRIQGSEGVRGVSRAGGVSK